MNTSPPGFEYVADFLSAEEQVALLRELASLEYQHDTFRGQTLKRRYAQFGYAYVSIGRKLEPAPTIPAFLHVAMEKVKRHCPPGTEFNQCIVTHYPAGAKIGWHTDAPCFGECVVGVSLDTEARLQLRANRTKRASFEVRVAPGSMYLMRGAARWEHEHQLMPVKGERYSLTFRHVPNG